MAKPHGFNAYPRINGTLEAFSHQGIVAGIIAFPSLLGLDQCSFVGVAPHGGTSQLFKNPQAMVLSQAEDWSSAGPCLPTEFFHSSFSLVCCIPVEQNRRIHRHANLIDSFPGAVHHKPCQFMAHTANDDRHRAGRKRLASHRRLTLGRCFRLS
jgi:hypothetical protein